MVFPLWADEEVGCYVYKGLVMIHLPERHFKANNSMGEFSIVPLGVSKQWDEVYKYHRWGVYLSWTTHSASGGSCWWEKLLLELEPLRKLKLLSAPQPSEVNLFPGVFVFMRKIPFMLGMGARENCLCD